MLLNVVFDLCINMVFNRGTMKKHSDIEADRLTIEHLGGPTKLAELLGYDKKAGGVQRIQNWTKRGIPSDVKLRWPELFLTELMDAVDRMKASDDVQPPVGGTNKSRKMSRMEKAA
jgi:hypothetical protein